MSRVVMIVVFVLIGGVGIVGRFFYQGEVNDGPREAPALPALASAAEAVLTAEPSTVDEVIPGYSTMSDKEQGKALGAAIKAMEDQGNYSGKAYAILRSERRERFHNADEIEYGGNGYVPKGWVTN